MRIGLLVAACSLFTTLVDGFSTIAGVTNPKITWCPKTPRSCHFVDTEQFSLRRYKTSLGETSSDAEPIPESKPSPFVAIINLFGINEIFRLFFVKYAITFPASLSGCGALFATFLFAPIGGELYIQFSPGATELAKWLPVFFVPSLIALPLANSLGSATEVRMGTYCFIQIIIIHVLIWLCRSSRLA